MRISTIESARILPAAISTVIQSQPKRTDGVPGIVMNLKSSVAQPTPLRSALEKAHGDPVPMAAPYLYVSPDEVALTFRKDLLKVAKITLDQIAMASSHPGAKIGIDAAFLLIGMRDFFAKSKKAKGSKAASVFQVAELGHDAVELVSRMVPGLHLSEDCLTTIDLVFRCVEPLAEGKPASYLDYQTITAGALSPCPWLDLTTTVGKLAAAAADPSDPYRSINFRPFTLPHQDDSAPKSIQGNRS